jgi:hypothetical protein
MYAYGNPMDNLSSGLRSGAAIGGMIKGGMDTSAVQNAAQRIQAGENQQAVISELMAQSPQAAQQLMNLLGGQQNLDAGATEIEALKTKVGMQSLQQAALPIFGALQVDDDGARGKLLNEAAAVFEKQSPETAAVIRQIGGLQGKQQFDAVAGIVKSLRSAGVFPDDPSQLQSTPAAVKEFEYYQGLSPEQQKQFGLARGYIQSGREESKTPQERNFERYNALTAAGKQEEADAFGRSAGIVSKEGMALTANSEKRLSQFNDSATEAGRMASKYELLANDFEKSGIEGGILGTGGTWSEAVKDLSGNQDEITELRREFNKIRASEVVNNLPPGAASDADIALALSGFPTDKANATQVGSFLRGVAKLKKFEAEFNTFKADYISSKGTERGMLQEWKNRKAQPATDDKADSNVVEWGSLNGR